MNIRSVTCAAAVALFFGITTSASAQAPPAGAGPAQTPATGTAQPTATPPGTTMTPTWELSAGYQLLHVPDQTFPFGLNVDAARNFGPWSGVAEIGWAHDSDSVLGNDVSFNSWNFGVGPRWSSRSSARIWPFAQVLFGAEYMRTSVDTTVNGVDLDGSDTRFMLQPGVGVSVVMGDGWGLVGSVDYRRVFLDEDETGESGQNDVRLFIGARMILD